MTRRVLASLLLVAAACVLFVQAADTPKKKDDKTLRDESALQQERLLRQYTDFEQALLRLALRLERSAKPEDQARAKSLKEAIRKSSDENVKLKFEKLVSTLRASKEIDLQEIKEAMEQSKVLAEDIRTILSLLLSDNRDEQLKAERATVKKLLEMLDKVLRDQKVVRAQTETGKAEAELLAKSQGKVTDATKDLSRAMDKDKKDAKGKDGKDGKGEPKDGKDSKDGKGEGKDSKDGKEGKDSKGEGKDSKDGKDSKGEGKDSKDGKDSKEGKDSKGEGKDSKDSKDGKGEGKDSKDGKDSKGQGKDSKGGKQAPKNGDQQQPNDQQPQQQQQQDQAPLPGKKQVQDAIEEQKRAQENLNKQKNKDASRNQDEAIKKLEEAKKKLEAILKQIREEELERLLADLQRRFERMLQLQIGVAEDTVRIDKAVNQNSDRKPDRQQEQESLKLSDREQEIVREADRTLQLLAAEGSAVAFAEVMTQVRDDMRHVARRLGKADVGHVTQAIEQDIIAMLKEMIEAVKKQQQQMQDKKNQQHQQQQQNGEPPPQGLLDLIAELKMVRSLQVQVNNRTTTYGRQYQGEQAGDQDIVKELGNLAQRQQKIFEVTNNLAKGKNK